MTLKTRSRPVHSTQRKPDVLGGFMLRVGITDYVVIIWAVLGAQLIRFGPIATEATLPTGSETFLDLRYTTLTGVLVVAWVLMLQVLMLQVQGAKTAVAVDRRNTWTTVMSTALFMRRTCIDRFGEFDEMLGVAPGAYSGSEPFWGFIFDVSLAQPAARQ